MNYYIFQLVLISEKLSNNQLIAILSPVFQNSNISWVIPDTDCIMWGVIKMDVEINLYFKGSLYPNSDDKEIYWLFSKTASVKYVAPSFILNPKFHFMGIWFCI